MTRLNTIYQDLTDLAERSDEPEEGLARVCQMLLASAERHIDTDRLTAGRYLGQAEQLSQSHKHSGDGHQVRALVLQAVEILILTTKEAAAPAAPPQAPPADWQARTLAAAKRLGDASPEARTIMAIVLDLYRERDTQAGLSAAVKRCRGSRAWTPALAEAVELVARELGIEVCPDEAAALAFLGDRPRGLAERLLIAWGYPLLGFVAEAEAPSLDDQIQRMEEREARGGTRGIPSLPRRRLD